MKSIGFMIIKIHIMQALFLYFKDVLLDNVQSTSSLMSLVFVIITRPPLNHCSFHRFCLKDNHHLPHYSHSIAIIITALWFILLQQKLNLRVPLLI